MSARSSHSTGIENVAAGGHGPEMPPPLPPLVAPVPPSPCSAAGTAVAAAARAALGCRARGTRRAALPSAPRAPAPLRGGLRFSARAEQEGGDQERLANDGRGTRSSGFAAPFPSEP